MFTRRHSQEIAAILASVPDPATRYSLASKFACWFKRDNPRFDLERFYMAVKTKGETTDDNK